MIAVYSMLGILVYHHIIKKGANTVAVIDRQETILEHLESIEQLCQELYVMHSQKDTDGNYIWHFKRGLSETLQKLQSSVNDLVKKIK